MLARMEKARSTQTTSLTTFVNELAVKVNGINPAFLPDLSSVISRVIKATLQIFIRG